MSDLVLVQQDGPVAILTLNRPQRHNSLVPALLEQMLARLDWVSRQAGIRAVVLAARGRSFSTGGDVQGFADHLSEIERYAERLVGLLNQVMLSMIRLPQPIVAVVHGVVTGGSLGLVLASDVVLVSPGASFTPYYAVVGFSPDGGWTAMLPQVIGQRRTAEVLLRNLTISADEAVAWGLANLLVAPELLEAEAHGVARSIADMQPGAVETGKRLLWQDGPAIGQRLEAERQRFVAQIGTAAAQASMAEFLRQLSNSPDR